MSGKKRRKAPGHENASDWESEKDDFQRLGKIRTDSRVFAVENKDLR